MKKPIIKIMPVIALLIKWSGIGITDGRNKIGGTVLSKSRSGATARNKVTPINRRSSAQSFIRALFAGYSQRWRTLSSAQIAAWNAFATSNLTVTNIFGDTVTRSGKALYVALNINLSRISAAPISDPPASGQVPVPIDHFTPSIDIAGSELVLNCLFVGGTNNVPMGNTLVVWATPALSQGTTYVRSQLRVLTTLPAGSNTDTTNLYADYVAMFGVPVAGGNVVLAVQDMESASGITSTPFQARAEFI